MSENTVPRPLGLRGVWAAIQGLPRTYITDSLSLHLALVAQHTTAASVPCPTGCGRPIVEVAVIPPLERGAQDEVVGWQGVCDCGATVIIANVAEEAD